MTWDRRGLLCGATALFGATLAAPLERALAVEIPAPPAPFSPDQRGLAAAVSERILPTTDTPGAIAAGVPQFIETMLGEWYGPGDRAEFLAGLDAIDGFARAQDGKSFALLTPQQQDANLTCAMTGMMPGLPGGFFEHCRQLVILGYYTSEIGCRQERVYLPVPGRYDGAYPYARVNRVFSS